MASRYVYIPALSFPRPHSRKANTHPLMTVLQQIRLLDPPPTRPPLRPLRLLHRRSQPSSRQRFTGRIWLRGVERQWHGGRRRRRRDGAGQRRVQERHAEFEVRMDRTGIAAQRGGKEMWRWKHAIMSERGGSLERCFVIIIGRARGLMMMIMWVYTEVNTATPCCPNSKTRTIGTSRASAPR